MGEKEEGLAISGVHPHGGANKKGQKQD